jgi:sugar phosphate isomerase/epimerase
MRSGVAGMMPGDLSAVDDQVAARIRAAGFTGASCFLNEPLEITEAELGRVRATLAGAGVAVAQANTRYECLVNPDAALRQSAIQVLHRACRCTRWLGATNLLVRPGSLNPRGQWWPHPRNAHPETVERLISVLKAVVPAAEDEGIVLALEGHVVSPLSSPEIVRDVIESVGSPAVRFNADPVNYVGCLADAWNSTVFLNRFFDVVGRYAVVGHAKDVMVEDRHVVHLSECVMGTGLLDLDTFVRRFDAACPDGFALVEHLPDDLVPQAKAALDAAAARAGIAWK